MKCDVALPILTRCRLPPKWLWALFLLACSAVAVEPPAEEYQVKAAFLYNFARFVEWPTNSFQNSTDLFTICIFGEDPFGHFLIDTIAGKTIAGRALRILRIDDSTRMRGCQILFLAGSIERKRLAGILASTPAVGVLTVGELEGFIASGGIINLTVTEGRVRFQINRKAAGRANLAISSRLLSLAQLVDK